jgi:hypothetical protein
MLSRVLFGIEGAARPPRKHNGRRKAGMTFA